MLSADVNQSHIKGGQRVPEARIKNVLKAIEGVLKVRGRRQISIAFVTPGEIRKLNRKYRGKDKITDILSFPYEQQDVFGEVLICYSQAEKQAKKRGHSVKDEVIFLLIHGILHVFGYDHENSKDKKEMYNLQDKILDKLDLEVIYD